MNPTRKPVGVCGTGQLFEGVYLGGRVLERTSNTKNNPSLSNSVISKGHHSSERMSSKGKMKTKTNTNM